MKNIFIITITIIVLIAALAFFSVDDVQKDSNSSAVNQNIISEKLRKAPNFSLFDYEGNIVSLSDFIGKPVIVNAWATWCSFCRKELPDFAQIQKEFGDDIIIIAIDRAEPLALSKKYSDELGVTDSLIFLLDPKDSFYASIGGFSMPETIFIDKEGNIRNHKRGVMDVNEIRKRVKEAFDL